MTFDPAQFFQLTAAVMFLAAGFDLAVAFLTRGERESGMDGRD